MLKLNTVFKKRDSTINAAIILALVVIAAYSPLIFLGQSYFQILPIPPELLGYEGKSTLFGITVDYSGYPANWPEIKLATELFLEGKLPLWDPYIGVGQPLAAESNHHIFSPLNVGFFLPVEFWDVPLLVMLWIASVFTYLFLRNLGLSFTGSVSGGIFYMLSGGFAWYLINPNTAVMMFTPFILYSLEKIIQNRNPKYIALGSIAFLFAILGSHLESIILQFMLVGLYLSYRILYPTLSNYYTKRVHSISSQNTLLPQNVKRILSWSVLAFLGGLGLSAFFILPVYEFIENNYLERGIDTGSSHANLIGISSGFLPYILGSLHAYWGQFDTGFNLWSYVGILSLFFSIVGVYLSLKNKNDQTHKYTPLFFLVVSVFFIMKGVGVPVVNWIGYIPILNLLSFTHYAGVIIPFGFAISAAFGIDLLSKSQIRTKTLGIICIITISTILLLLIPLFPYLSPDAKFPSYVTANDARNYVGFQILQAVIFAVIALVSSIAVSKNKSALLAIIPLILLELSLYIPVGLHPLWMAYKAIVIISAMIAITVLIIKPNRIAWDLKTKTVRLPVIAGIVVVAFSGVVMVSEVSPFGMMKRYDSFQQDPVTDFLKENLGNQRMFSFDYTLGPNYPAAYKISTIGQLSPFNINSFYSFIHNFLDEEADAARLGFFPWTYSYGPMGSIDKFLEHKKYFDFLGVKYILTEGYDFNTFAPGIPGQSGQFTKIQNGNVAQNFISPVDSIKSIGVSLGSLQNQGDITLTIDSVSQDQKHHRESTIHTIANQKFNQFEIIPPLTDVQDKELYMTLRYQSQDSNNFAIVFTYGKNQTEYDPVANKLQGKFYENGIVVDGKQMAFSITSDSNEHPIAFRFHDINIHENKDAFPRAFLVTRYHITEEEKAQDYLKENPDFDLRNNVILERELPSEESSLLGSSVEGTVEITSLYANKVTIKTSSQDASLLVLTDSYYPGWKAYLDGKETLIYRADGIVRAVFVPAGNHDIEFSYLPESFVIGATISVVSAIILAGVFVYWRKKENAIFRFHD